MGYAKLIDGELRYAPIEILQYSDNDVHKCVVCPTDEHYMEAGYKIVEVSIHEDELVEVKEVIEEKEDKIIISYEEIADEEI